MSSPIVIRPVKVEDREAVAGVAYATGFFGESAARYFPARKLFELLWVGPYFLHGPPVGFIAEQDGLVVGYIVGSTHQATYQQDVVRAIVRRLYLFFPSVQVLRSMPYLFRLGRFSIRHADWQVYPAHLHINLLPSSRGLRMGEKLLQAYLSRLEELGIGGVQLSTTTENRAALGLYRKFGFQRLNSKVSPLWTPWLGHPAEHVILGRLIAFQGKEGD